MRLVVRSTDMVRSVTAVRDVGDGASGDVGSRAGDAGDGVPSPAARRRAVYLRVAAMQLDAWNVSAGQVYWSYRLRGGRGEFDRLAPPAPGMGDGTPP